MLTSWSEYTNLITIGKVTRNSEIKKLDDFFKRQEINDINLKIEELKKNLEKVYLHNLDSDSFNWPPGLFETTKQMYGIELIKWDYFNLTHLFFNSKDENVEAMSGKKFKTSYDFLKF